MDKLAFGSIWCHYSMNWKLVAIKADYESLAVLVCCDNLPVLILLVKRSPIMIRFNISSFSYLIAPVLFMDALT